MSEEPTQYERGMAKMKEVYAGEVPDLPEGSMPFYDVMMKSLFAEVWDRDVLDIRSRRLLLMGAILANGAVDIWKIQARAALRLGELDADQLREVLVTLAPYAGYPNVAPAVAVCEEVINSVS